MRPARLKPAATTSKTKGKRRGLEARATENRRSLGFARDDTKINGKRDDCKTKGKRAGRMPFEAQGKPARRACCMALR